MSFIETIGSFAMQRAKAFAQMLSFAAAVFYRLFIPGTYNSATRTVLVNQIYFTSIQILPAFLAVSVLLGSVLIGIVFQLLKNLGLTALFGNVLMGLIVTEFSPLFTVLLITLRSGAAINTEMAAMKVNQEIKTLEMFRIDVINYLLAPRVVNGIISVVLLSFLFSIVLMGSGILFSRVMFGISADVYVNILLNSTNFSDIVIALVKCAAFGFFITFIPIYFGLRATHELTSIPIVVSRGMVSVFAAILIIEVLSLLTKLM